MVGLQTRKNRNKKRKMLPLSPTQLPGPSQCRPRMGEVRPDYGCLPPVELNKLAVKVFGSPRGGNTRKSLRKLREDLAAKIGADPDKETEFLEKLPIDTSEKSRLQTTYLRPKMPDAWEEDPDMWLDSLNIKGVMEQYQQDRNDFEFLGPFPIDFAAPDPYSQDKDKCLIGEMCSLNLADMRSKGKTKIGIIYNLDPHYKSGSHWVANFIDLVKNHCYYFDSYGMKAPGQIYKFMQSLTVQDPKIKLAYNARRHQYKGSECGMYSMYFIICMLKNEPFRKFCHRAPRDNVMLTLRNWLFAQ